MPEHRDSRSYLRQRIVISLVAVVGVVAVVAAIAFGVGDQHGAADGSSPAGSDLGGTGAATTPTAAPTLPSDGLEGAATSPGGPGTSAAPGGTTAAAPLPGRAPADAAAALDVIVLDSTSTAGLATRMSLYLASAGWFLLSPGVYSPERATTTIFYPDGYEDVARALAPYLTGLADVHVGPNPPGAPTDSLTVVLGSDATAWSPPA